MGGSRWSKCPVGKEKCLCYGFGMSLSLKRAPFRNHAREWLTTHTGLGPREIARTVIILAAPVRLTKTSRGNTYEATRWFFNLKQDAPRYLLLALDHAPRRYDDFEVREAFLVPGTIRKARQVFALYDTARDRREGTLLDRYRLKIRSAAA